MFSASKYVSEVGLRLGTGTVSRPRLIGSRNDLNVLRETKDISSRRALIGEKWDRCRLWQNKYFLLTVNVAVQSIYKEV